MTEQKTSNPIPRNLLRELCFVVFRHRWKSLILFSAITAIFLMVAISLPAVYVSEAELLLRAGRESMPDPIFRKVGEISQGGQLTKEQEIRSELQILRSRELTEKIIAQLGIDFILPPATKDPGLMSKMLKSLSSLLKTLSPNTTKLEPVEKAIRYLQKGLAIQNPQETGNILISFASKDPQQAHRIVTTAVEVYKARHLDIHKTPGSLAFFREQTDLLTKALEEKEKALRDLKNSTGITSLPDKQRGLLEKAIDLRMRLLAAKAELTASQARMASLEQRLALTPEMVITAKTSGGSGWNAAERMRERLFELELKEQELLADYPETSVHVQEIRRQIARAKAIQKAEAPRDLVTRGLNTHFKETEMVLTREKANCVALQAKADSLSSQWSAIEAELKKMDLDLNSGQYSLARLSREIGIIQENLRRYQSNLEQARITAELEKQRISNISIIQPATLPFQSTKPNRLMIIALGFILAAAGTLGLIIFLEFQDQTCKSPLDISEKIGIPVLTTIRKTGGNKSPFDNHPDPEKDLQIPASLKTPILALRDQILLQGKGKKQVMLGITSCGHKAGTTTIAANLAAALAGSGLGRILLVDANPDRPTLHGLCKESVQPGFTNLLQGEDVSPRPVAPNLDLLPAGILDQRNNASLSAMAKPELLATWAEQYAFAIFDLPPFFHAGGPFHLISLLDATVLTIQAEKTRLDALASTREQLARLECPLLGAILNQRLHHVPDWLYSRL